MAPVGEHNSQTNEAAGNRWHLIIPLVDIDSTKYDYWYAMLVLDTSRTRISKFLGVEHRLYIDTCLLVRRPAVKAEDRRDNKATFPSSLPSNDVEVHSIDQSIASLPRRIINTTPRKQTKSQLENIKTGDRLTEWSSAVSSCFLLLATRRIDVRVDDLLQQEQQQRLLSASLSGLLVQQHHCSQSQQTV